MITTITIPFLKGGFYTVTKLKACNLFYSAINGRISCWVYVAEISKEKNNGWFIFHFRETSIWWSQESYWHVFREHVNKSRKELGSRVCNRHQNINTNTLAFVILVTQTHSQIKVHHFLWWQRRIWCRCKLLLFFFSSPHLFPILQRTRSQDQREACQTCVRPSHNVARCSIWDEAQIKFLNLTADDGELVRGRTENHDSMAGRSREKCVHTLLSEGKLTG